MSDWLNDIFLCHSGIRIQTTLAASIKRKYTVWGVTELPAEKLQFDVKEELTGRKVKTTVAKYFKDRYNLPLRYCSVTHFYIKSVCFKVKDELKIKSRITEVILVDHVRLLKPRPNDRNMSTQAFGHMLGVVGSSLKMVKLEPTTSDMSQHGGQTHATCCTQQYCNMLRWHVAIVWPGFYITK